MVRSSLALSTTNLFQTLSTLSSFIPSSHSFSPRLDREPSSRARTSSCHLTSQTRTRTRATNQHPSQSKRDPRTAAWPSGP
jgi:hypothetical protein